MDFDDIITGEEEQATPAIDEQQEAVETTDEVVEQETTEDAPSDVQDTQPPADKTVPLDVVTALKEQNKALKEQNEKILELLLKGQQPPAQQAKEPEIEIDDQEFVDGKTVKQLVNQAVERVMKQVQADKQTQAEKAIATQIADAKAQYTDYEEVHQLVMQEAAKNPGIEAYIMKSQNPPAEMYKFGKYLMGQTVQTTQQPAKQTAKAAVQAAAKIDQNQQQPRTLSAVKGNSVAAKSVDAYLDEIWDGL